MNEEQFKELQQCCVQMMKSQDRNDISALGVFMKKIDTRKMTVDEIHQLSHYTLVPLRLILKIAFDKRSDDMMTDALECISEVLKKCPSKNNSSESFQDLFTHSCMVVSYPGSTDVRGSEALKCAVISCLDDLISSYSGQCSQSLYGIELLPLLGQCISIMLWLSQHEKSLQIRQLSLDFLHKLIKLTSSASVEDAPQMLDAIASFMPGILTALSNISMNDLTKQHHSLIVKSLNIWEDLISTVLDDTTIADDDVSFNNKNNNNNNNSNSNKFTVVNRTWQWASECSVYIEFLTKRFSKLSSHSNYKVRTALVNMCSQILSKCYRSLEKCMSTLLEILVGQVNDEYLTVREVSEQALVAISERCDDVSGRKLTEFLEENLHILATSLPRLIRTADDSNKLSTLKLVVGYLKLLGPNVHVLNSTSHLRRLSTTLIQSLEFEAMGFTVLEESSHFTDDLSDTNRHQNSYRKSFKNFHDEAIHTCLVRICRLMGYYGDLYTLTDCFLDIFNESRLHRKQAVYVMSQILLGINATGIEDLIIKRVFVKENSSCSYSVISYLIDVYTSPTHWHLPTLINQSDETDTENNQRSQWSVRPKVKPDQHTLSVLNNNILLQCLMVDSIGCFAQVLGEDFKPLLVKSLFSTLEKLSDETALISQTAYVSLLKITTACGYSSLAQLIYTNADYLINDISMSLRHSALYPKSPQVLKVMLKYSNVDILPLLDDTIDEIFDSLDFHYLHSAQDYLSVLHVLVSAINCWFPAGVQKLEDLKTPLTETGDNNFCDHVDKKHVGSDANPEKTSCIDLEIIRNFFLNHHKLMETAQGNIPDLSEFDGDDINEESIPEPTVETEEISGGIKTCELHVKLVKQVLEKCTHLMSTQIVGVSLLTLDIINVSMIVLKSHQDDLLPLVHKIWSPLTHRFHSTDLRILMKAYMTLLTMSTVCGDFVRRRVSKEVLPEIIAFLHKNHHSSRSSGRSYQFTLAYKTQLLILGELGRLCEQIDFMETDLFGVADVCVYYLDYHQPQSLQQSAIIVFESLMRILPDAIWLFLNDIYCPLLPVPPHPCLHQIQLAGSRDEKSDYANNINILLAKL